jgi:hypothetical protein
MAFSFYSPGRKIIRVSHLRRFKRREKERKGVKKTEEKESKEFLEQEFETEKASE